MKYRWNIAITIEPLRREVEEFVEALTVQAAIIMAIEGADLQPGEMIHEIHVGPPKAVGP